VTAPEIIKQAVQSGVVPLMREHGYRKNSTNFYKSENGWITILNVQSSRWNTADSAQVVINLGTYSPALAEIMERDLRMPDPPQLGYCSMSQRMRIGEFDADRDRWWGVTPETDPAKLANFMRIAIVEKGLPWLDRMTDAATVAKSAEDRQSYWEAAAWALILGDRKRAAEFVRLWIVYWESHISQYSDLPALIAQYPRGTPEMLERTAVAERRRAAEFISRIHSWAKAKNLDLDLR
jgi:hypothetical protein